MLFCTTRIFFFTCFDTDHTSHWIVSCSSFLTARLLNILFFAFLSQEPDLSGGNHRRSADGGVERGTGEQRKAVEFLSRPPPAAPVLCVTGTSTSWGFMGRSHLLLRRWRTRTSIGQCAAGRRPPSRRRGCGGADSTFFRRGGGGDIKRAPRREAEHVSGHANRILWTKSVAGRGPESNAALGLCVEKSDSAGEPDRTELAVRPSRNREHLPIFARSIHPGKRNRWITAGVDGGLVVDAESSFAQSERKPRRQPGADGSCSSEIRHAVGLATAVDGLGTGAASGAGERIGDVAPREREAAGVAHGRQAKADARLTPLLLTSEFIVRSCRFLRSYGVEKAAHFVTHFCGDSLGFSRVLFLAMGLQCGIRPAAIHRRIICSRFLGWRLQQFLQRI